MAGRVRIEGLATPRHATPRRRQVDQPGDQGVPLHDFFDLYQAREQGCRLVQSLVQAYERLDRCPPRGRDGCI
jgi:hypothetical protein